MEKITLQNDVLENIFNQGKANMFCNYASSNYINKSFITNDIIHIVDIEFDVCQIEAFTINIRNNNSPITIKDCVFKKKLTIQGVGNILIFDNVIFENDLHVEFNCKHFKIENCKKNFSLYFKGEVSNAFKIEGSNFNNFILDNCGIASDAVIKDVTVLESAELAKSFQKETILSCFKCDKLTIGINRSDAMNAGSSLSIIQKSKIGEITFSRKYHGSFKIDDSEVSELKFNAYYFAKETHIQRCIFKDALYFYPLLLSVPNVKIEIGHSIMPKLCINGKLPADSSVVIYHCQISTLEFQAFKNLGNFQLSHISKIEKLSILSSNLGKSEIHNCNFSKSKFEFDKSQINEIFISETDFPKKIHTNDKLNHGQGKLAYGQLQTVFQSQGDSVRSYEYLAREINSYYQQSRLFSKDFFTIVNLWFNKISNDFGRNWVLGFGFSFLAGLIFFYFLILSTDQYAFAFHFTPQWNLTGPFLKFMNPLRHFEAESLFKTNENIKENITLSNWSYLWDFFGRIFVAYGYYQTIQAFRKFGKK